MTAHDQFILDNRGSNSVDCPYCKGEGYFGNISNRFAKNVCDECDGSGQIHPTHRKELLTEMRTEL